MLDPLSREEIDVLIYCSIEPAGLNGSIWKDTIDKLISYNLMYYTTTCPLFYQLTASGYEMAQSLKALIN